MASAQLRWILVLVALAVWSGVGLLHSRSAQALVLQPSIETVPA